MLGPAVVPGCGAQDYCQEGLEGYENFIAISVAWLWLVGSLVGSPWIPIPMDPLAGWIPKIYIDSIWINMDFHMDFHMDDLFTKNMVSISHDGS